MPTDKVQGEGDYEAARNFVDAEREFVESGQVQKAAGDAAPKTAAEAAELERAEQEGRSHSKGEVPGETSPTTTAQPPKGN